MINEIKKNNFIVANYYRLNGAYSPNEQLDANTAINTILNSYYYKYKGILRNKDYSFIFNFENDDILNYLAYRIILCLIPFTTVSHKIYICSSKIIDKKLYPDAQILTIKKARKMKKVIYITPYHPIFNVINKESLSKNFKTILNPLETLTPSQLFTIQDFYIEEESHKLFNFKKKKEDNEKFAFFYDFWYNSISDKELTNQKLIHLGLDNLNLEFLRIYEVSLGGTEKDFPIFDKILSLNNENTTFVYRVQNEEQAKFIFENLRCYMSPLKAPNDFNVAIGDEKIIESDEKIGGE